MLAILLVEAFLLKIVEMPVVGCVDITRFEKSENFNKSRDIVLFAGESASYQARNLLTSKE